MKFEEIARTFLKFCTSGVGAAQVAETTGYMPPNKAANEMLGDFYKANPNKLTAVKQAGLLREWIAYPGDKGLAITQVIYDMLESIVTGEANDMKELQAEMVEEVSAMLEEEDHDEKPKNAPPVPESGLPEGWTMEQWEWYGHEWLAKNGGE